jgi:hypothetical protein
MGTKFHTGLSITDINEKTNENNRVKPCLKYNGIFIETAIAARITHS